MRRESWKRALALLLGASAGCLAGLGAITWASPAVQQPTTTTVSSDRWYAVNTPESMTTQDAVALIKAIKNKTALPLGFSLAGDLGNVELTSTGLLTPTKWQAVATLVDDQGDIDEARLYVDGVLKKTATYANGQLEDIGAQTVATMTQFLPLSGSYSVRVEWETHTVTVARTISFPGN